MAAAVAASSCFLRPDCGPMLSANAVANADSTVLIEAPTRSFPSSVRTTYFVSVPRAATSSREMTARLRSCAPVPRAAAIACRAVNRPISPSPSSRTAPSISRGFRPRPLAAKDSVCCAERTAIAASPRSPRALAFSRSCRGGQPVASCSARPRIECPTETGCASASYEGRIRSMQR